MKRGKQGSARYVRRIPIGGKGGKQTEKSGGEKRDTVRLTVRGLSRGTVRMEAEDGSVFACSKEGARGALWGDVVEAERIGRERVRVVKVLEHAHTEIVGVLREKEHMRYLVPLERRLPQGIAVRNGGEKAQDGDIVHTKVVRWEDEGGLLVRIDGVIGSFGEARAALDALIVSQHLRVAFAPEALHEADACRPAVLEDDPARSDLRGLMMFTIDGSDAKDFDDAVSIERLDGGRMRLGVHIADVGYYVPQGSALDREAYLRGTSVYFPGRVLPMLPEQISNGVCSLRPNEDKFTMSALMDVDETGGVVHTRLLRTITRSKARLVYDDVNRFFDGDASVQMGDCAESLWAMRDLARRIRSRREAQGAIDFDTDEPQFILDDAGEPVGMIKRARGEAERMIEDFMLTANEAVARFAKERGLPLLYRVHEQPDPDKLDALKDFLDGIGVDTRGIRHQARPSDLRAVLERTREAPEFSVVSMLMLRSMQKARYDVSPLGHYGLAMEDYCHFTSPIRRYPDLTVSRALSAVLMGGRAPLWGDALTDAAVRSSACERTAVDAERLADKLMTARFMYGHIGESFDGVVSGVSEWGAYVALSNGAEGFLSVRTLEDWFDFDERHMLLRGERTGAVLALGQSLRVRVENVTLESSSVDLALDQPLKKKEKSPRKKERERIRGFRM